jgi:hypothetical protein
MKLNSKIILFAGAVLSLFLVTSLESCKKYDDGPMISFRSRAERVANNWKVDSYNVNDNNQTSLLADYKESYTKEGNYSYTWGILAGTGTWSFQNKDKEILLLGSSNQEDHVLFILKLEEESFWYYYMDGNDKHELHLIAE